MKRVAIVLIVLGLMLAGCNSAVAEPLPTPGEPTLTPTSKDISLNSWQAVFPSPTPAPAGKSATSINVGDMPGFSTLTSVAVAPAEINIGGLYPGARAEWNILIHNGDGLKAKQLEITTDAEETTAAIPLVVVLANNGLLDIISIESTLNEHLEAIAYDSSTRLLTIKGFVSLSKRIVKIVYRTVSTFRLSYRAPVSLREGYDRPPDGTAKWITYDKTELQLRPMENGSVTVILQIPENAVIESDKWEFAVSVTEGVAGKVGQVSTIIEYSPRIFVTMR